MDRTFSSKAIVLNRRDWRETDRLVSVYTPDHGLISLLARGASKFSSKLAAHIEPISLSQIMVIKGKTFNYLGSAIMIESFSKIKGDLNKLYFAGQAFNFFSSLVREGQKDELVFRWLERWLNSLEAAGGTDELNKEDGQFRLLLFYNRLLSLLGYALSLDRCLACQKIITAGDKNRLDLIRGGLICPDCQPDDTGYRFNQSNHSVFLISDNCIKLWRYLAESKNINLKNIKFNKKLLKEWEILHKRRIAWLDV
ncbi:MAG: DNA repair protein RecO [Clostridia bacterium]|nr:DNA repair protein RecO [Clostridia bacterium]